jgi:hypothetical protein
MYASGTTVPQYDAGIPVVRDDLEAEPVTVEYTGEEGYGGYEGDVRA